MKIESSKEPREFTKFEHQGWETISRGYEQHFGPLTSQSTSALLDLAEVGTGVSVLDVCCGPGMISAAAVERGAKASGIDFSSEAINIAKSNVEGAEFREGDAQSLPFDDASFDAVVCGFGIIHVPEPRSALAEMYRVLRPGGRASVSVWEAPSQDNGFGLLYGAIKKHADMEVPIPHGPDFFQFSDRGKLGSALQDTGFRDPSVDSVDQFWDLNAATGLITSIMEGAVRARGLIMAQADKVKESIYREVEVGMERYRTPGGVYRVPMPALIGSAAK